MADDFDEDLDAVDTHEAGLAIYSEALENEFPDKLTRDAGEAAYAYSERCAFVDGITVKDPYLMIQIWAIVETIRRDGGFPEHLRM